MEKKLRQDTKPNCIKVVFFGPESTGKTVLCERLAAYYDTVFAAEFSRIYSEAKAQKQQQLTQEDVLPIAIGQMALENAQLEKAENLLICDTDLLETKVYSEYYYDGFCPPIVKKQAVLNTYDLYFLTYIDTTWKADGIRDQPNNRQELFNIFENELQMHNKTYVTLKGDFESKFQTCIKHINGLLNQLK